jgi:capsid protein
VHFEKPAQPQQLAWGPELKVQRSAAVDVDGGYGTFTEGTLQAIGELNGARTHAHARQVDLESVRWSCG